MKYRKSKASANAFSAVETNLNYSRNGNDTNVPTDSVSVNDSVNTSAAANQPTSKLKSFIVRTVASVFMIGGFIVIITSGHLFVILLVILLQGIVFKEVIAIAHVPSKEKDIPWFRSMNWYFLFATNYFLYGESLLAYFREEVFDFFPSTNHHRFVSFLLYLFGLILFVLNLKKGFYKFQFGQLSFTHMTLLLVVFTSHFIIHNILDGLIYFILPASLVIINDISAYIFGIIFGKTPLIKLSPRKTWEGFIGGAISTLILGFVLAGFLASFNYLVCPANSLFGEYVPCTNVSNVFLSQTYYLPTWLNNISIKVAPIQFHALILSMFASLIAPFGGFFASGFKRAFKVKDFSDSIPGHGGITDRMDCQFLMGLFAYIYAASFIKKPTTTVSIVFSMAIQGLDKKQLLDLYNLLKSHLESTNSLLK